MGPRRARGSRAHARVDRGTRTHPDRRPGTQEHHLGVLQHAPGVLDYRVDRECRQPHAGDTLEHGALGHHHAVVLDEGDLGGRPGCQSVGRAAAGRGIGRRSGLPGAQGPGDVARGHALDDVLLGEVLGVLVGLAGRGQHAPVAQIGLVAFMDDVADQVGPGDAVRGAHQVGMGDGAEGLANVGGVGNIAMGGEKDRPQAIGVTGVPVGGFFGVDGAERELLA